MGLGVSKPVDELMRCWLIPTRGNHVSVSKGFDVLLSASGSVKKSPTRFSPIGLLENEIRRLVVSVPRQVILEEDLSTGLRGGGGGTIAAISPGVSDLKASVTELEKRMILGALREHRQNQQQAARSLGLSRQGLIKKMKRYGIKGE